MKRFACLLVIATFAAVASGHAQSATDQVVEQNSGIHHSTPRPGTAPTTTAAATGPMEIGLFKDAKGKESATTFGVHDTVYLACKNVSASKGDKLGAIWYQEKDGKSKKAYDATSAVPDTGVFNPSYNMPAAKPASPAGTYRVELVQNSKVIKKLSFTIK